MIEEPIKKFTQRDLDNAIHEGYKVAEKLYQEVIIRLKKEINSLKVELKKDGKPIN